MAYIDPLPRATHSEFTEELDQYKATRGVIPNSILAMQPGPQITAVFMALNKAAL